MEEYLDKRRVQTADGDGEPWFRGRNYFRMLTDEFVENSQD